MFAAVNAALIGSAALLGLAGTPHCAAMCGAACTAVTARGGRGGPWLFQLARVGGYSLAGAVAAGSIGSLSRLAALSPALKPFWVMAHLAALALGLWLLWTGRQPGWLERLGGSARALAPQQDVNGWQRLRGPAESALAGSLWFAWPCGLLQSALVIAALADDAAGGAVVMAGFAIASGAGLAIGPWLWLRLGGTAAAAGGPWAARAAGVLLAAASGWALFHGLWERVAAYCFG